MLTTSVKVINSSINATARPKAPPTGYAKINIDIAIVRSHAGGAAARVCRDAHGNYLGSSSLVIHGVTDIATLEVVAYREALSIIEDLRLQSFIITSNSKQVVNDIARGIYGRYEAIISEIQMHSEMFNCKFTFE